VPGDLAGMIARGSANKFQRACIRPEAAPVVPSLDTSIVLSLIGNPASLKWAVRAT
jgi:hypothetical protein